MIMNLWIESIGNAIIIAFISSICLTIKNKNKSFCRFVLKHKRFLSPNNISMIRLFAALPILLAYHFGTKFGITYLIYITIWVFTSIAMTDWLDGVIARSCKLKTKIGAILDALADKCFDLPILWYFCFFPTFSFTSILNVLMITIFDVFGQFIRGKNSPPEAGLVGKTKTVVKFIIIYINSFIQRYPEQLITSELKAIIPTLLVIATILAGLSMGMKTKWYREYVRNYIDDFLS